MKDNIFKIIYLSLLLVLIVIFFTLRNFTKTQINQDTSIIKSKNPEIQLTDKNNVNIENGEVKDWRIILINSENPVPNKYKLNLVTLSNGQKVDNRILTELQDMFNKMRQEGLTPVVESGYRSFEEQKQLFEDSVNEKIKSGKSKNEAIQLTKQSIAYPGTSEHHIGLAVDITSQGSYEDTQKVYDWLAKNAYKYGFILRYPYGKTEITKVFFEPWHYRYVGIEHATEIYNKGIVLEEYLGR